MPARPKKQQYGFYQMQAGIPGEIGLVAKAFGREISILVEIIEKLNN